MSEGGNGSERRLPALAGVQKLCLAIAAAIALAGAAMWSIGAVTGGGESPPAAPAGELERSPASGFGPQGFTDDWTAGNVGDEPAASEPERTPLEVYSPTVFRLGFGFFVGFAIAYALRAALKIVLIVSGVVLLLLIGLQMGGLISVNWEALERIFDGASAWLGRQTESLAAFLRGYIPSGASAVAGFGVGMMRKR